MDEDENDDEDTQNTFSSRSDTSFSSDLSEKVGKKPRKLTSNLFSLFL